MEDVRYYLQVVLGLQRLQEEYIELQREFASKYPDPQRVDARNALLSKLMHVFGSSYLAISFHLFSLNSKEYLQKNLPDLTEEQAGLISYEYQQYQKLALVQMLFYSIDSTFRVLFRAIDVHACKDGTDNSGNVFTFVLSRLGLKKFQGLADILNLLKNTAHNNGVHTGEKQSKSYKGKEYLFDKNKMPEVYEWLSLIQLISEVKEMILEVAGAKKLVEKGIIPDSNAEEIRDIVNKYFALLKNVKI